MKEAMRLHVEIAEGIADGERYDDIVTEMTKMTKAQRVAKFGVEREADLKALVTILAETIRAERDLKQYRKWTDNVDSVVGGQMGVSVFDLDVPLKDWYLAGVKPLEAGAWAIEAAIY